VGNVALLKLSRTLICAVGAKVSVVALCGAAAVERAMTGLEVWKALNDGAVGTGAGG